MLSLSPLLPSLGFTPSQVWSSSNGNKDKLLRQYFSHATSINYGTVFFFCTVTRRFVMHRDMFPFRLKKWLCFPSFDQLLFLMLLSVILSFDSFGTFGLILQNQSHLSIGKTNYHRSKPCVDYGLAPWELKVKFRTWDMSKLSSLRYYVSGQDLAPTHKEKLFCNWQI